MMVSRTTERTARNPSKRVEKDNSAMMDDQLSIPDTASTDDGSFVVPEGEEAFSSPTKLSCDACPHCDDCCGEPDCLTCDVVCQVGSTTCPSWGGSNQRVYTTCQVRRHNHEGSAWLVAGDMIYDATAYMHIHPGGTESILRKAGGAGDCTRDFEFHSKKMSKHLEKIVVGKLRRCPCEGRAPAVNTRKQWWPFW
jgi:cytochrome b involved in lipid metabolism